MRKITATVTETLQVQRTVDIQVVDSADSDAINQIVRNVVYTQPAVYSPYEVVSSDGIDIEINSDTPIDVDIVPRRQLILTETEYMLLLSELMHGEAYRWNSDSVHSNDCPSQVRGIIEEKVTELP